MPPTGHNGHGVRPVPAGSVLGVTGVRIWRATTDKSVVGGGRGAPGEIYSGGQWRTIVGGGRGLCVPAVPRRVSTQARRRRIHALVSVLK